MSFCKEVKTELTALRPSGCCKPSLVYGLLLFGRSFSFNKISIQSANEAVAKFYCDLVWDLCKIRPTLSIGGKVVPTYKAEIESEADRLKILAAIDYGISDEIISREGFYKPCCIHSFIRGAFLSCGNINDPEKEYRAEFNVKNEKMADELLALLAENGVDMRKVARQRGFQLYTKDSGEIEDLLTLMGAGKHTLSLIDTKIMKSIKNNINRARNCDNANISKTVEASIKQRSAIEFLESTDRLQNLPKELLDAAILRRDNPNATLKELCRLSSESITVSGLNHRLKKLIEIYENAKK